MIWLARWLCKRAFQPAPLDLGLRKAALRGVRLEVFSEPQEVILCLQPVVGTPTLILSRGYLAARSAAQVDAELFILLTRTSRIRRILGTWALIPSWITHWAFADRPSPIRALGIALVFPWHRLFLSIAGKTVDLNKPFPGFSAVMTTQVGASYGKAI